MVVLYLLLSCVLPLVMYGVMALDERRGGGGSVPTMPASTPFDLGPPSGGGPMLPIDPSEAEPLDAGAGPSALPTVEPSPPVI